MRPRTPPRLEDARARTVLVTTNSLFVDMVDGRRLVVPLEWFPKLLHAAEVNRMRHSFVEGGASVCWPQLDEDISIADLLAYTGSPDVS